MSRLASVLAVLAAASLIAPLAAPVADAKPAAPPPKTRPVAARKLATPTKPSKPAPKKPVAKPGEPRLAVSAVEVNPGDPVLVTVDGGDQRPHGSGGKISLEFFPVRGGWQAVFAVPLEDPPDKIEVTAAGQSAAIAIRPKEFPVETATVEQDYAAPPPDKRPQVDADNAAVIDALKNSDPPMWKGKFRRPGPGRPTSPFGVWRSFNGDPHKSRHLGLDLAAFKGGSVRAVQAGKVALVRDGFLMGGIVVLVHGAGVASTYFHLSDTKVAVGAEVTAGQVIGKVSLTGRTTGPHIHLGLWVPGGFVNPAVFEKLKLRPLRALPK